MSGPLPPLSRFSDWWNGLASRERRLTLAAAALLAAALLWWVALAPALHRLKLAREQQASLEAQWQQMQSLKAQATALQSQTKMSQGDAQRMLEKLTAQTLAGSATLMVAGDRATVTLKGAPPQGVAQWLVQARANAHVAVAEARFTNSAAMAWDGSLVLQLPAP